ncbi:MAG: GIY-YIG nuclease family protein [Planctomycetota bacterium]
MLVFTFFALAFFFFVTTFILFVFALEDRKSKLSRPLRRWRYARSKRKEIGEALEKERKAYGREHVAKRDAAVAEDLALKTQLQADERVNTMGSYIIAEQYGEHFKKIKADNFESRKKKIERAIIVAEKNGYKLPPDEHQQIMRMLKQAHHKAILDEREKQKQAAIKEQIREEQRREREIQKAIKDAEKEERIKRKALEEAIRLLGDTHSEQLDKLKAELAEAQEKMSRTMSMAQQTKAGHIYVISNVGSFGREVFKVGMTRRLEPMDRVRELGDASVPFSFDVHAMFSSDDAPALEAALHRDLEPYRVNKVNYRKEFFKADITKIIESVQRHHGEVNYEADPEALEYFESVAESSSDTSEV